LKRSRAVGVSARPGSTVSMQEVVLDRNVRLLDSPGVVFSDQSTLLGGVDEASLDDPIPPVEAILKRCDHSSLLMTYNIPTFPQDDVMVFLAMIAKVHGRVLKGGIPDKVAAARTVLRDWNSGKIPFYTPAPVNDTTMMGTEDSNNNPQAIIVSQMGKELDLAKLDQEVLSALKDRDEMDFVQLKESKTNKDVSMDVDAVSKALQGDCSSSDGGDDDDDGEEDQEEDSDDMEVERTKGGKANLKDAEDYDFDEM
jgi:nuclear GTP-binding protein